MVRSVADVRTLTCALYHVFYGAINAINTPSSTHPLNLGENIQLSDYGGGYVEVGKIVNVFFDIYTTANIAQWQAIFEIPMPKASNAQILECRGSDGLFYKLLITNYYVIAWNALPSYIRLSGQFCYIKE